MGSFASAIFSILDVYIILILGILLLRFIRFSSSGVNRITLSFAFPIILFIMIYSFLFYYDVKTIFNEDGINPLQLGLFMMSIPFSIFLTFLNLITLN